MNTEQIIKLATEAHLFDDDQEPLVEHLEQFAALVTQAERDSRQVAQAENEQLKARLARSGVELRRAVHEERESCAKWLDWYDGIGMRRAEAIRAGNHIEQPLPMADCTNCDCADNEPCRKTDLAAA